MAQRQWRSDDTDTWLERFGDGSDGSSYSVPTNEGCSGTASGTSLTLASAGSFSNDDLVLIHQSRGTGVGTWELNKISSGGGGTSLTMSYDLMNTYTDSGDSQAQIIKLNQYEDLTSGAFSVPAWDGSKGGIVAFFDIGTTTLTGNITGTGLGFRGASDVGASAEVGGRGEGTTGDRNTRTHTAQGNGGGGMDNENAGADRGGGGGAGHVSAGVNGTGVSGGGFGYGGASVGDVDLISMNFGGGTGAGWKFNGNSVVGKDGGGIICIFASDIDISSGGIVTSGINGTNIPTGDTGTGGSSGGSILFKCETATLGTTKAVAAGSSGGSNAGAGSAGRIHIDYSDSISGTTNPTLDSREDTTITSRARRVIIIT